MERLLHDWVANGPYSMTYAQNTYLSPLQEILFQASPQARDVFDYDSRGAWLDMQRGLLQYDARNHLDDYYKKGNHPTFSVGSKYNGQDGFYGGAWYGGPIAGWAFYPNVTNVYSPPELQQYYQQREPGNVLWDTGVRW